MVQVYLKGPPLRNFRSQTITSMEQMGNMQWQTTSEWSIGRFGHEQQQELVGAALSYCLQFYVIKITVFFLRI